MEAILSSPIFGLFLCFISYEIGLLCYKKLKTPFAHPMLIAVIIIIAVLTYFSIPYAYFENGAKFISVLLGPVTAVLAVNIYKQVELLKQNALPIILGCSVGSITSMVCVIALCKLFNIEDVITASLFTKSVTSAIAIPLTEQSGGFGSIAAAAVMCTGISGAVLSPYLIKIFTRKSGLATGIALGTSSHALGTAVAFELGEVEAAMSGLAIGVTGLATVLILQIVYIFIPFY